MIQKNYSLKDKNTFQINAVAKNYCLIRSENELFEFLKTYYKNQELLILGGGSNILFVNDFEGIILENDLKGIEIVEESENEVVVNAMAGENWHQFVLWTLEKNLGGLQNLSLIPGRVGAAPMQNIGAYGVEIKDVFHSLDAVEIKTGIGRTFSAEECNFGYRESVFKNELKNKFIITSVSFNLTKNNHKISTEYGAIKSQLANMNIENPTIQDVSGAVIAIRESKLPNPKVLPNAGSFFKNPTVENEIYTNLKQKFPEIPGFRVNENQTKIPAGWLIETAGWKGKKIGNVGVHDKQALVLVNYENGTGKEIYDLSAQILSDIQEKFGIKLEREVNII